MSSTDYLTFTIFIMGLLTVTLSIIVSAKFNKFKKALAGNPRRLSKAITWQLIGEAIIGIGTLVFTTAAYFDVLSSWDITVQSLIRFIMFFATATTTIHLLRTLKFISED